MENKKIVKYVGIGVLSATLILGGSIAISEANFDHTEDVCLIGSLGELGRRHQMHEMWEEYQNKEIKIDGISYRNKEFIPVKDNELLEDLKVKIR